MKLNLWTILCALLVFTSCNDTSFNGETQLEKEPFKLAPQLPEEPISQSITISEKEEIADPVDILFLLDTSASMLDEKILVEAKLIQFIEKLQNENEDLDYHVYLVAAPDQGGPPVTLPQSVLSSEFTLVPTVVDSWNALGVMDEIMSGNIDMIKPLRENSIKEFVVITDDDAQDLSQLYVTNPSFFDFKILPITSDEFRSRKIAKYADQKIHVNGFIGQEIINIAGQCRIQQIGSQYLDLATDEEYKGFIGDLCTEDGDIDSDWDVLFEELANQIIAKNIETTYSLQDEASQDFEIVVSLNNQALDANQFTILAGEIVFNSSLDLNLGDVVEIKFFKKDSE